MLYSAFQRSLAKSKKNSTVKFSLHQLYASMSNAFENRSHNQIIKIYKMFEIGE